jgi:hypothetical protein
MRIGREQELEEMKWLPDMDLNHDKQIQSLLCYRYTIGQGNVVKLEHLRKESRHCGLRIADCGLAVARPPKPAPRKIRNPQSAIRN